MNGIGIVSEDILDVLAGGAVADCAEDEGLLPRGEMTPLRADGAAVGMVFVGTAIQIVHFHSVSPL